MVDDFNGPIPVKRTKYLRYENERKKEALEIMKGKNNQHAYFNTFFNTFSDAFDPTVSLVRAKNNGVWMYQVALPKSEDADELGNTYII